VNWPALALVGVLLLALGGAVGFIISDRTADGETATVTRTETVAETRTGAEGDIGVPAAVETKRAEILRADDVTVGPQGYLGWRAGILPDGSWIYFVSGD